MQDLGAQEIANTLHILAKQKDKATGSLLLALKWRAEEISRGSSTRRRLQTRCGRLRQWGDAGGADDGATGGADGGGMREVQLAQSCKHAVGVCNDGDI
jgi:hypothetical protein